MPDILLVEDNPLDARATFNAAQKLDMAEGIHVVSDGQAALDYLQPGKGQEQLPGLVLLDLNLPGKNGFDVLAEIRSTDRLRALPVVVLSTSDENVDIHNAYASGANAYVTKPTDLAGWLQVISTINDFWLSVAKLPR